MRLLSILVCALTVACGGKNEPPRPATVAHEEPAEPVAPVEDDGFGGDAYGGAGYGGWGSQETYTPPPPQPPDLVGAWASACAATATRGEFRRLAFDIRGDRWDLRIETFGDPACAKRRHAIHVGGPYAFGAQSSTVAGAWDATFSFDARDVFADDARSAKALARLCGVKVKAKQTVDILAAGCAKLGMRPQAQCAADHDVVAIEGDRIRFGVRPADNDLCAAEKRPAALETSIDLVYQWSFPATGMADCDRYIEAMRGYVGCAALPAEARTTMFGALKQVQAQWSQFTSIPADQKPMANEACKQAVDAFQQTMSQSGC